MLPGISNLTERARYFSVYPWVLHEYAQRSGGGRGRKEWRTWIRSLEFTYALACAAHEKTGDVDVGGVVGAVKARALLNGLDPADRVTLEPYVALNDKGLPKRGGYFSNPEGGYGQYYRGPLTQLGVLAHGPHSHPNRQLTNYAGRPAALACASAPGFDDLLAIAQTGSATVHDLVKVGSKVQPGALAPDTTESSVLSAVLLGEDDDLCAGQQITARRSRRSSLLLMLQLVDAAEEIDDDFAGAFRWACLNQTLPSGKAWEAPIDPRTTQLAWGAYQRNEVFNFALECLFWAGLELLNEQGRPPRALAADLAKLGCASVAEVDGQTALPSLSGTVDTAIARMSRQYAKVDGRWDSNSLYGWTTQLEQAKDVDTTCALAGRVLFRHLRVAMRKLANQGDSTFKFRPEQGELIAAADNVEPTFTNPRVRQGHRILSDLRYFDVNGSRTTITARGRQLLQRSI